jgi:MFS family permease
MFSADRNIRAFVLFRIGFNTRFYYPVLAVMFIDYGLTMEQYTLLNVVWAAAIVGFEVPSGALADVWSRKRLVTIAASIMVVEMLLLVFAPPGGSAWLFPLMLLNRFLSGVAEASASGADEALAYDSLRQENREGEWSAVLERLGRWQAVAFMAAMLVGAFVYDQSLWFHVSGWLGQPDLFPRTLTVRFPALLTLAMSLVALAAALRMREPAAHSETGEACGSWRQILETGRWILRTPRVLALIALALCLDSVIRLIMTFQSSYLRWIDLPDWSFGLIGAGFAVISFNLQPVARRMADHSTVGKNLGRASLLTMLGLIGCAFGWKWFGVLFALLLGGAMTLVGFFLSYYLNQWTDSARRATVLSFKGLSFNLAYGTAGLAFAFLLRNVKEAHPGINELDQFGAAIRWLPAAFLAALTLSLVATGLWTKRTSHSSS